MTGRRAGAGRDRSRDGRRQQLELRVLSGLPWLWRAVEAWAPLRRIVNRLLIGSFVRKLSSRPNRLSTMHDHTSWESLVDRTWSGRHLPAVAPDPGLPDLDRVAELFVRRRGAIESDKSTLLFTTFAQWFTDGFLRTDPANPLRNTSTHEVDLSQLYGQRPELTALLRGRDGRMAVEDTDVGPLPPRWLGPDGSPRAGLAALGVLGPEDTKDRDDDIDVAARRRQHFALGIDRGNIGPGMAMMSTLFLREHNRLCDVLQRRNGWSGDRLFDGARAVLTVMLVKVVIEDYIAHISPYRFRFRVEPGLGEEERWYRQNWISIEFGLLYRWHALVPDEIVVAGERRATADLRWDVGALREAELGDLFEEVSAQPAGALQLGNSPSFLLPAERRAVEIGRIARLASYNDYRRMCGFPTVRSFEQVTGDPERQAALRDLYGTVDRLEYVPGLLAEDVVPGGALPPLMGIMVGVDAFSQALTNPLLNSNVYGPATFSAAGLEEIERTRSLADIVERNVAPRPHSRVVTMTRPEWRRP